MIKRSLSTCSSALGVLGVVLVGLAGCGPESSPNPFFVGGPLADAGADTGMSADSGSDGAGDSGGAGDTGGGSSDTSSRDTGGSDTGSDDTGASDTGASDVTGPCTPVALSVTDPTLQVDGTSRYWTGALSPALGGAAVERLQLEVWTSETGTIDLGWGGNENAGTCNQCLRVFQDWEGPESVGKQFHPTRGTIVITEDSSPQTGALTATLTGVTLVEVTIAGGGTGTSTPVAGGECLVLEGPALLTSVGCEPDCEGKVCGADGCGGTCGEGCGPRQECSADRARCGTTCDVLSVVSPMLEVEGTSRYWTEALTPELRGAAAERLQLELWTGATGVIDLASGANANFGTCNQCVRLFEDRTGASSWARQYYPISGTLEIAETSSPQGGVLSATLSGVELVEVTISGGGTGSSMPVANGGCVLIAGQAAVSTEEVACAPDCESVECGGDGCGGQCPACGDGLGCVDGSCAVVGQACANAADCGAALVEVCDVGTRTCAPGQCAADEECGEGRRCLWQADGATMGACYGSCQPGVEGDCGGEMACKPFSWDWRPGYCVAAGSGVDGSPCAAGSQTHMDCSDGFECVADGVVEGEAVCRQVCSVFDAAPGCPGGLRCSGNGVCLANVGIDPAGLGEPCTVAVEPGSFCGDDGAGIRGLCDGALVCRKVCRPGESDCAGGGSCDEIFTVPVGVCGGCVPDCAGKACAADDGCGGTCGACPTVSFTGDVMPLLQSLGCTGSCHASRYPVMGGAAAEVYGELTAGDPGLVNKGGAAENARLLTRLLPGGGHGGGSAFGSTSDAGYQTLLTWITEGYLWDGAP